MKHKNKPATTFDAPQEATNNKPIKIILAVASLLVFSTGYLTSEVKTAWDASTQRIAMSKAFTKAGIDREAYVSLMHALQQVSYVRTQEIKVKPGYNLADEKSKDALEFYTLDHFIKAYLLVYGITHNLKISTATTQQFAPDTYKNKMNALYEKINLKPEQLLLFSDRFTMIGSNDKENGLTQEDLDLINKLIINADKLEQIISGLLSDLQTAAEANDIDTYMLYTVIDDRYKIMPPEDGIGYWLDRIRM